MNEYDQKPIKRGRGRPVGTGRPKMSEYLNDDATAETGAIVSRAPVQLDTSVIPSPQTMLPKAEEAGAVPDMIRTVLAIRQTVDLDDPTTLWNALEQYISLCSVTGMKISNSTLYMACGVGRNDIHNWAFGLRRQNNPEYRKFATTAREICAAAREQYGIEGQVNPILTIFHQKFYDGLKDNPPDEAKENPLGEITDPQKLAEKYKDIIVD